MAFKAKTVARPEVQAAWDSTAPEGQHLGRAGTGARDQEEVGCIQGLKGRLWYTAILRVSKNPKPGKIWL